MENPLHRSWVFRMGVTLGVLLFAIIPVQAAPVTVPPGLNLGDQYRLAFVTSSDTQCLPTFTDIGVYNSFVTDAAISVPELLNLGTIWFAIVSTPTVHAIVNTYTLTTDYLMERSIYNLNGELVATGSAHLWTNRDIDPYNHYPITYDQNGQLASRVVWTGTDWDGYAVTGYELGAVPGSTTLALSDEVDNSWIRHLEWPQTSGEASLYAISAPLTVPVPVPPAIWLLGSGLVAFFVLRRKGRKAWSPGSNLYI